MNKGGQKTGLQRGDRTRFPYEPRVIGGKLVMPAELQRIHRTILDAAEVEIIPMRCVPWWKAYGPSWRTSCRISTAIEMALKLPPTGLGSGIDKDRPDYTVY